MKIFLTGANGKLGNEVLNLIPSAIPLVRKPSNLKNEIVVDISNIKELKNILKSCDILIHLAGSMSFHKEKELQESNIALTKNLLYALPKTSKIIYASSISIYGKRLIGTVDEKTPVHPDTKYAKTKYEAEQLIMQRPNSISLRIGPIYGPQYLDYQKFLKLIKKGKFMIFGNGMNQIPFIHVQDVAKAIKNSIKAKPGIYLIVGKPETQQKIYEIAANSLGVNPPKNKIPVKVALVFASMMEKYSLLTGKKPFITKEHIMILSSDRKFNCKKAEKELKFKPRSIEKGIKEIVQSMER
ncbi:NAD-dependent epimerase/dehydratase family protein [Candidatus Micrarchaeota archaeon]|nr:NAD-dependent epimerase/dehydratase family protein [Candidatus Micrarchaeota archaeon]